MTSETDLYRKAQIGDEFAFKLWADTIQPNMGRFSYQLGVSIEALPKFQRRSLQQLHRQLEYLTQEQAQVDLYKIMVQQLSTNSLELEIKENLAVLGFPEDDELHAELQKLELNQRIPLVLTHFHNRSKVDIAMIAEKTEHQIIQTMNDGLQALQHNLRLDEAQVFQRLAMLQKSYQRFMPPAPFDQEIQGADEKFSVPEVSKTTASPRQIRKKPAIVLGAASLFLITVIGVSFSVNDQLMETAGTSEGKQAEKVTDEMVADWHSKYEMIKETSPERLGMSQKQYVQLDYVKLADAERERVFSDEMLDSLKDDPIKMESTVYRLFWQIETPQGMVDSLSSNSMLSSAVDDFLLNYAAKTDELRFFVEGMMQKYQQELETTIVMGQLSPEKLVAQSHSYPEQLRKVIEALPEYNLLAIVNPNDNQFRTIRDVNKLNQQHVIASHPYAFQYLSWLSGEPYFDDSGFFWPIDNITHNLISMEESLLVEEEESALFDGIEVAYQQTFWQLVKGSDSSPVFDKQGKVKVEYQSAWNSIASSNPMAFIILPILEEMEASEWTTSAAYDELEFHDLQDALEMEKSGQLADKLPNGNLMIEDEFVDMQDFDYSRIQSLYESFKVSHDLQLLSGVQPLDVLFVYHYANKVEDAKTQWHLLADSPLKPTLETFIRDWKQIPELTKTARWIELSSNSFKQRVKDKVYMYPQVDMYEFDERLDLLLVTEKNQIWQIDYRQYESYDLQGEDQQFKQTVDLLYQAFSVDQQQQLLAEAKPGEIAGVFFKAVENEDILTVKNLMEEVDWKDEDFTALFESHSFRPFSELAQLTFKSHFAPNKATGHAGSVEILYASGLQDGLFPEHFFMEKTKNGWRMSNINEY
ncbi:hypothetical protein BBH88_15170 [Planococcus antarcticus DSM 14505]|uniref:Uncharacterized protein n=1 Tax=Planococcus antarcticus DSM 14505 TaxID=1185653 RepID=A0ABM6D7N4_9BACL|nr:hypothetical protein [Planococcus antarcticus]ANU11517.1 hypothetical protein BBH88_15170 [Planococcus antarcticus DSM 14505]